MVRSVALLVAACLLAGGCASFPEEPPPTSWSAQPQLTPQAGPRPELPEAMLGPDDRLRVGGLRRLGGGGGGGGQQDGRGEEAAHE